MKADNLIGYKFGKLTVIKRGENSKTGKCRWICKCDCGKTKKKPVLGYDLKSGRTRSCGCEYKVASRHRNETHGESRTRLYRIWNGMKRRCTDTHHKEYNNYGGRGILYSPEWENYENFREWALENGYNDSLTIDRIDNSKGYYPDNCRWATMKQQQNNRRNNIFIEIDGEKLPVTVWAERTGISSDTLVWRKKHGWTDSEILMPTSLNNKNIRSGKYE